jgi:hypothetical protein
LALCLETKRYDPFSMQRIQILLGEETKTVFVSSLSKTRALAMEKNAFSRVRIIRSTPQFPIQHMNTNARPIFLKTRKKTNDL